MKAGLKAGREASGAVPGVVFSEILQGACSVRTGWGSATDGMLPAREAGPDNAIIIVQDKNKHRGAVVPLVTPVTPAGDLDEAGLGRMIDFMLAGKVDGIFVLGTTGEGPSVPRGVRCTMVERALAQVGGRALVYAGIGDTCLADSVESASRYLRAGVDAVVAQPPGYFPLQPGELLAYFTALLDAVPGPVIIYNIPSTTHVSVPLEVVAQLQGHPRLVGIKDSENDAKRHEELIGRFGGAPGFSIFVGVPALMAQGLKRGANGIVPSVGNLVPDICARLCRSVFREDWAEVERQAARMLEVAELYRNGRTLGQSVAALKAALSWRGLIQPHVLPPLVAVGDQERETIRADLLRLGLLN